MRLFHENLRNLLLRRGYRVDCVRSIPCQLLDPSQVIRLEFEDAVCRRMVEVVRPLKFVQIGAFDGTTHDPLYPFIVKHGWAGVLVEPQRIACKLLRELHKGNDRIQVVNAAIAEKAGTQTLYRVERDGLPAWCGGLASFSKDSILKHEEIVDGLGDFIVSEEVVTIPFSKLLKDTAIGGFDVFQIDTEGADAEILRLFPFEEQRPAVVHFEIKHLRKWELESCLDRLSDLGYRFALSGGENLLAVADLSK